MSNLFNLTKLKMLLKPYKRMEKWSNLRKFEYIGGLKLTDVERVKVLEKLKKEK